MPGYTTEVVRAFMRIGKGDTPETNSSAKLARDWAAEWLQGMQLAFGPKETVSA